VKLEDVLARMLCGLEDATDGHYEDGDPVRVDCRLEGRQHAEQWSPAMLVTPEGKALAALIEAAVAWRNAYAERWDGMMGQIDPPDPRIEADATLGLVRAVGEYLRLGDVA
jgi:hypothetical protein